MNKLIITKNLPLLPEGWEWVKMEELCEKITDGTHFTPTYLDSGTPFISVKDIRDDKIYFDKCKYIAEDEHKKLIKRCHPQNGDVLITKSGTIGRTAVVKVNRQFSLFVSVALLKPIKKYLNSEFISYSLKNFINGIDVNQSVKGGVIKNLHIEDLKEITVPLPPHAEQNRLVAKIEELFTRLDAGVEALKHVQTLIKRYRQSVLKSAVEGKLTSKWHEQHKNELEPADKLLERILKERRKKWEAEQLAIFKAKGKAPPKNWQDKYKEPTPPDTSKLPELPEGWVWVTFDYIGELNRGKSKHRPRNDPKLYGGKYPFIQTGDIRQSNKFIKNYSKTYNEIGLKQSRLWSKGTLCITIAANIADTAILEFDACFPDSVVGFIPSSCTNVYFIEYFLRTAKENLERYAPATAQKNINLEILNQLAIPLPPKSEQKQIVDEIDRLFSIADEVEEVLNNETIRSQSLRQSILKIAFEGKLVPQDPNDEPASFLLERIKAEKSNPKKAKQMEMS